MEPAVVRDHLVSFQRLWEGGYFTGDPLNSSVTPYGLFGYIGIPHVVYLTCIRGHVKSDTVAVELGPGRGAWTRTLLGAREVWCLDALSAEHNGFWEYVGPQPHVRYFEVEDFSCAMLPDAAVDFVFSYDTLCHVPFEGIEAYATALYGKMRPGAHGFWMVADREKYRDFIANRDSVASALTSEIGRRLVRRFVELVVHRVEDRQRAQHREHLAAPEGPEGNWWYWAGTERATAMLERVGYRVVDPDVGADPRSPILHFVR